MRLSAVITAFLFAVCDLTCGDLLLEKASFSRNATQRFYSTRSKARQDFAEERLKAIQRDIFFRRNSDFLSYDCHDCLSDDGDGNPVVIRVMFVENKDVVENKAAEQAAIQAGTNYECGSCCFDPVRAHPECFVPENWDGGWVSKPTLRILARTGAKLVAMTPANLTTEAASMSFEKHPYALCPLEILLGNVDLCVGDWWETLSRRTHVQFSTPLDVNHFKLITLAKEPEGFKPQTLLEMFQPFSGKVWGAMLGIFLFAGLLFWLLDEQCEDFNEAEAFPRPQGFAKGLWVAAMGYFAGNQFEVMSWPARIVLLGYSFFLATTIAAYTANLASFMVQKQADVGLVTSLNDIVMRGKSLCVVPDVANMITEPGILERVVMVSSGFMGSMFEMMRMGACDAALVGKMEYLLYAQAENMQYDICTTPTDPNYGGGFFCVNQGSSLTRFDLTKCQCGSEPPIDVPADQCPQECVAPHTKFCAVIEVLDPTLRASLNYALPTADWFEPYISAGVIASKLTGEFHQDYKTELVDSNPHTCPSDSAQRKISDNSSSRQQAMSLSVQQMAGTFLIAFLLMAVGVAFHLLDLWSAWWRSRTQIAPDDEQHASFVREASRKRTDWELTAGLKLKSVSPVSSPHSQLQSAANDMAHVIACEESHAAEANPDAHPPPPPAAVPGSLENTADTCDRAASLLRGGDGAVAVSSVEGEVRLAEELPGWGVGRGAAAGQGVVQREAELARIQEALAQVTREVKQIREGGLVITAGAQSLGKSFGRTTSGGAGNSFRKRQGR